MLTEEELEYYSSIDTGYKIARERYIKEILSKSDKEFADRVLESKHVPIFTIFNILGEDSEQ